MPIGSISDAMDGDSVKQLVVPARSSGNLNRFSESKQVTDLTHVSWDPNCAPENVYFELLRRVGLDTDSSCVINPTNLAPMLG